MVSVTAGALTLAATPAFAGGEPSSSSSYSKADSSYSKADSSYGKADSSYGKKDTWSKSEHEKWTKDPSGGVETGVGGSAASDSSLPVAPAAAGLGGLALIGGSMLARRRRGMSLL
ncbi:MAG: hypothetical protein ACQSGP_09075 [Frankia sp.]